MSDKLNPVRKTYIITLAWVVLVPVLLIFFYTPRSEFDMRGILGLLLGWLIAPVVGLTTFAISLLRDKPWAASHKDAILKNIVLFVLWSVISFLWAKSNGIL